MSISKYDTELASGGGGGGNRDEPVTAALYAINADMSATKVTADPATLTDDKQYMMFWGPVVWPDSVPVYSALMMISIRAGEVVEMGGEWSGMQGGYAQGPCSSAGATSPVGFSGFDSVNMTPPGPSATAGVWVDEQMTDSVFEDTVNFTWQHIPRPIVLATASSGLRADLSWDNAYDSAVDTTVQVDWGDGAGFVTVTPSTDGSSHNYAAAGTYVIQAQAPSAEFVDASHSTKVYGTTVATPATVAVGQAHLTQFTLTAGVPLSGATAPNYDNGEMAEFVLLDGGGNQYAQEQVACVSNGTGGVTANINTSMQTAGDTLQWRVWSKSPVHPNYKYLSDWAVVVTTA